MPVYLDVKNPFYITEQNKMHYGAELADGLSSGKYDGVMEQETVHTLYSVLIKSNPQQTI